MTQPTDDEKMQQVLHEWIDRYEYYARYVLNLYLIGGIFVWVGVGWIYSPWSVATAVIYTLSSGLWVLPIWQFLWDMHKDRDSKRHLCLRTKAFALRRRRALFGEIEYFLYIHDHIRLVLPNALVDSSLEESGLPICVHFCERSGVVLAWQPLRGTS